MCRPEPVQTTPEPLTGGSCGGERVSYGSERPYTGVEGPTKAKGAHEGEGAREGEGTHEGEKAHEGEGAHEGP